MQKTGAQNIVKEIKPYHKKWLQHVQRTDTNRLAKQALQCTPKGRRNIGRPRKRWRDQLHLENQRTGNTPNPSGSWNLIFFNVLIHTTLRLVLHNHRLGHYKVLENFYMVLYNFTLQ